MDVWSTASVVLIALAGCGFVLAGLIPLLPVCWPAISGHHGTSARRGRDTAILLPSRSCSTPERPLTVAEAHRTMQTHREHSCGRKRAAFETLIAAGHIAPDSSRPNERR
ncbi:hypothetical protein [Nocardia jiangxiensis]|uniref:Uncharacterized protein n=1 Tax=Nocardia jiangxiensis TaxID=282685 RepID=A0ABW6RSE8_9NOCA|nr:hypothetical protein [Nocardia jiangxiensis]